MFESFCDRDLKDTGSCDKLGAGAPVVKLRARGTTWESLIEGAKQKHTQREGLYDLRIRCRGVGQFWCRDQDSVEILVGTKTVEKNIWNEQP